MNTKIYHLYLCLTFAIFFFITSCADEAFINKGQDNNLPDGVIGFNVTSGFGNESDATRSASDNDDGLPPLLFSDGADSLYLHRYVASEIERATGHFNWCETRSTPINDIKTFVEVNGESGFRVMAMYTDDDETYFEWSDAKPLSSDENEDKWFVSPYKYWPGKESLCFNAYAPSSARNLLGNLTVGTENISFDYTVPVSPESDPKKDAEYQPDIMLASSVYSHYSESAHSGDLAPLNFRHALSAIKFAVRDVSKWKITDISIQGVAGSGSCKFIRTEDFNGFSWSNLGESTSNYTQTFDYVTEDPYEPGSNDPDHNVPSMENVPVISNIMPEKTFMLIPQTIPDEAKLVITLEYGEGDDKVTKTLEGQLKTDDIPLWEPGKEYVYTISTTSVNWTYVFEVIGSYQKPKEFIENKDNKYIYYIYGAFVDNTEKIEIDASVTKGSYYKVKSYRYRTNNPTKTEILPWTAIATDGDNTVPSQFSDYKDKIPMTVERDQWLLENWKYEDEGSDTLKLFKNLYFAPQYIATNYAGDWAMRAKGDKYGSENSPVDLSMVYGSLNTANCYVVNAGGWYSIPLYYGSSMKNGVDIPATYKNIEYTVTYTDNNGNTSSWEPLTKYLDYKGNPIESGEIKTPVEDAILVWQDAYGIIDTCRYDDNIKKIVFHVDHTYLQQANCVLAIRDSNEDIIWSWHIWVTDHWVNQNDLKLGVGDVKCKAQNTDKGPFDFAPYNLGWCDPKNVLYLKRSGKITFSQKDKEDNTIATKSLDIIQRSDEIEFWIGNSTYYQFGRKDPIVGFINDNNQEKYHYGEMPYATKENGDIADCILYPNAFFMANEGLSKYYNLWNNYNSENVTRPGTIDTPIPKNPDEPATGDNLLATVTSGNPNLSADFAYSANKTIYDPSPAGYVVPPCDFFQIFGIGNPNSGALTQYVNLNFFKGDKIHFSQYPNYFNYVVTHEKNPKVENTVTFNVNGQRRYWYLNMNPCVLYLWSNTNGFYKDDWQGSCAFGYVLGYDTNGVFTLNSYFQGSKLIARPVRCIKEINTTPSQ